MNHLTRIPMFLWTLVAIPACPGNEGETDGTSDTAGESTASTTGTTVDTTDGTELPTTSEGTTGTSTTGADTTGTSTTGDDATSTGTTGESATDTGETTDGGAIDPAIFEACKDSTDNVLKSAETVCECEVMAGEYPDVEACLQDGPPLGDDCACNVYAAHPETKSYVDCLAEASEVYASCIEQATCGDDMVPCFVAFFEAQQSGCGQLSREVTFEVQSCSGEGFFTCGSGEEIPAEWKCDREPDCADGSDEEGCV